MTSFKDVSIHRNKGLAVVSLPHSQTYTFAFRITREDILVNAQDMKYKAWLKEALHVDKVWRVMLEQPEGKKSALDAVSAVWNVPIEDIDIGTWIEIQDNMQAVWPSKAEAILDLELSDKTEPQKS